MGTFRPAFRSVAQSLTDIDLVLVEEAFERLLLVNIVAACKKPVSLIGKHSNKGIECSFGHNMIGLRSSV